MAPWPAHPRSADGGVDEVPLPEVAGRLWLCGKHAIGPDVGALMNRVAATTVACLVQEQELLDRYPAYVAWLRGNDGSAAIWFPIPDLHAPLVDETRPFVEELVRRLRDGERIVLHCAAGIGRSGTIATCVLLDLGVPLDEALMTVRANRPMAGPEVGAQRELVEAWVRGRR